MINVLSRQQFENFVLSRNINDNNVETIDSMFFICIHNTGGYNHEPYFQTDHHNVLRLWFDDCDVDKETQLLNGEIAKEKAMTIQQAKNVYDFLLYQKELGRKIGVVHCAAGIARSGAVGTFANTLLDQDQLMFNSLNREIKPNGHVLSLLNSILWQKHFKNEEASRFTL